MKKIIKNKTTLPAIIALLAAIVIAIALWFYWHRINSTPPSTKIGDTKTATVEDRPVGEIDYAPSKSTGAQQANDTLPNTPLPESTPASQPIPLTISHAGGTPLQIRVVINEILSSGTCTLIVKKTDGTSITQSASIFPSSSYTTCQGFTVDDPSVKTGRLTVSVSVKSGVRSGEAVSEVIR